MTSTISNVKCHFPTDTLPALPFKYIHVIRNQKNDLLTHMSSDCTTSPFLYWKYARFRLTNRVTRLSLVLGAIKPPPPPPPCSHQFINQLEKGYAIMRVLTCMRTTMQMFIDQTGVRKYSPWCMLKHAKLHSARPCFYRCSQEPFN